MVEILYCEENENAFNHFIKKSEAFEEITIMGLQLNG